MDLKSAAQSKMEGFNDTMRKVPELNGGDMGASK